MVSIYYRLSQYTADLDRAGYGVAHCWRETIPGEFGTPYAWVRDREPLFDAVRVKLEKVNGVWIETIEE